MDLRSKGADFSHKPAIDPDMAQFMKKPSDISDILSVILRNGLCDEGPLEKTAGLMPTGFLSSIILPIFIHYSQH